MNRHINEIEGYFLISYQYIAICIFAMKLAANASDKSSYIKLEKEFRNSEAWL